MQTSLPQYLAPVDVPASFPGLKKGYSNASIYSLTIWASCPITKNVPMQDFLRLTDRPSPWLYRTEDPVRNNMVLFYKGENVGQWSYHQHSFAGF